MSIKDHIDASFYILSGKFNIYIGKFYGKKYEKCLLRATRAHEAAKSILEKNGVS